jgi:hypothetical protein
LDDGLAGWCILGLKLFCFNAQNILLHALLCIKVSIEKSVLFWWVYLYMLFFSVTAFNSLSLCSVLII